MKAPTLMVMAGGTGGHIYPGIAVAEALRARGWEIAWLGNPDGMEARLVPERGYTMAWVRFSALRGKGVLRKLLLPGNLLAGFWQALRALRRIRPDVVIGMGGYVSFPGGMMAVLLGRKFVVHEQNSIAGLANRVLARVADRVVSGFPGVLPKAQWVGNPVRREIAELPEPVQRFAGRSGPLRLLVVGGSLGASALNEAVPRAIASLPVDQRPTVIHQSGERHIEALRRLYAEAGVEGELRAFIDDMASAYAEADLVICRAGALTIAELAAAGVASILVPYPHAVDDHQTGNARFLSERGAAWLLPQTELSAETLAQKIRSSSREQLAAMAIAARAAARADAAGVVADLCEALLGIEQGGRA